MTNAPHAIVHSLSSILLFTAALGSGCAVKHPPPPEPVSRAPLVVDEAMQHRKWDMSVAQYANGETSAGPTGFMLMPKEDGPIWVPALSSTPIFFADVLSCPFFLIGTPLGSTVIYPQGIVEPSYTAMPPLPPSPEK